MQKPFEFQTLLSEPGHASQRASIRTIVQVPLQSGAGTFVSFDGLVDGREHLALVFGDWDKQQAPLVRIHSECLTGDVFGSAKCDCGDQLQEAIASMQKVGGILLYLRQEGRGIGLYNKLDAYKLQALGHDTFEANNILGFADDLRNYTIAAQMLGALGVNKIQLLSNNPEKKRQLESLGIEVKAWQQTGVFMKEANQKYLSAKVKKSGHLIKISKD